jgi:coniferyl-aldehyde dehydrogenase
MRETMADQEDSHLSSMSAALAAMKAEHARSRPVTAEERIDRLRRLKALIRSHQGSFVDAAVADFSARAPVQTRMELAATLETAKHAARHVRKWMKPRRASLPLLWASCRRGTSLST